MNVLETTENMNLLICEHDSSPTSIFNGELRLSVFSCNPPNCSTKVLAVKCLDVFDFEGFDIQII